MTGAHRGPIIRISFRCWIRYGLLLKSLFIQERENLNAEEVYEKAGIYAEFGKVVCISLGFVLQKEGETQIRIKSIANEDEIALLQEFLDLLNSYYNSPDFLFCAHNRIYKFSFKKDSNVKLESFIL